MRTRTLAVALATTAAVVVGGCGSGGSGGLDLVQSGTLTVCSDVPYPPFENFKGGNQFTGFDIDLMRDIAKRLNLKMQVKDTDFTGLQSGAALNARQCDVAASAMTITPQRAKHLTFSDPYYDSAQSLMVPTDSSVQSLADLAGKKIGVQADTTGEAYAREHAPASAKIIAYPSDAEEFAAIQAGNVDALLQDLPVNLKHTQTNPSYQIVATYKTGEQYGFAFRKSGSEALVKKVNATLKTLRSNGTYRTLFNRYFPTQK